MKKIPIETVKNLIRLRNRLDAVSQISWAFSILNKRHPISGLEKEDAKELIDAYKELLDDLDSLLQKSK